MAIKDADRTVQYVQSDRFFIANAKYRGHVNRAEPDLPMSTKKHRDFHQIRDMKAYTHDRHAYM